MMSVQSDILIYGLIDPRTLMVRYVGLSRSGMKRPLVHGHASVLKKERTHKSYWIRKLRAEGYDYQIVILQQSTPDSVNADERWWIAYGRACGWPLTNHTDGGEGVTGLRFSKESRARLSEAHRGQRPWNCGKTMSEEQKEKLRAAHLGLTASADTRAKMSAAQHDRYASSPRTHCKRGHVLTDKRVGKNQQRRCRECRRVAVRSDRWLSSSIANEVRGRHEHGESYNSIAARLGIGKSSVHRIVTNKNWKETPDV